MLEWLLALAAAAAALWWLGRRPYAYWPQRGVPAHRPRLPFLGTTGDAFLGLRSFPDAVTELYEAAGHHSVLGFYQFMRPWLLVKDPAVLKVVTIKEFDHFPNHNVDINADADPIIAKNLFNTTDQRWRDLRATLSPAFTTSKMKGLFPFISECGQQMARHLQELCDASSGARGVDVEMKDVFSRLANDVIATAAFGISVDSLAHPHNVFFRHGTALTTFRFSQLLVFVGWIFAPSLMKAFGVQLMDRRAAYFFDALVQETVREREAKGIFRPDILQQLMLARHGRLRVADEDKHEEEEQSRPARRLQLSEEDVTAQAILFFFAGFETVSTALSFAALELAAHPEAQRRLQEEVDAVMARCAGRPAYEDVQAMKYLDMVVSESLRLHPAATAVDRQCSAAVTLPGAGSTGPVTVPRGARLLLPILGLHRDPQHWPHPLRFDPERFSDENKARIKPFTYLPFGLGPRMCIGNRLALLELKLALLHLVAKFDLRPSERLQLPMQYLKGFTNLIKGGFWCSVAPRAPTAAPPPA